MPVPCSKKYQPLKTGGYTGYGHQPGGALGRIYEELRRRNVFRVAFAYVVASWLVLQVADLVLENIEAPAWVMKVFMLVIALGFPLVLMFSWAYELTPEGLKREKDVDRSQSITPETGRKLTLVTIGLLVAVLVLGGLEHFIVPGPGGAAPDGAANEVSDNSIAVLAFEDLSPEGDQGYFADGLSEELLNVLAKVPELKVAGRTSSFAFKGQGRDLREIGELLNVSHILEGSVRKSGNRIRVTAQLIKASDGFHLFSETYDRELSDIFELQDEIAANISSALLTEIVGTESIDRVAETDPAAYELYLQARQRIHTRNPFDMKEALAMLDSTLEIDPLYAPALAQKALATYLLSDSEGAYGDTPESEAVPAAFRLVGQALALDRDLPEGHAIKGLLLDTVKQDRSAIDSLQRALELNPTMSDAKNWLSSAYFSLDQRDRTRQLLEEVVEHDPTYGPAFLNLTFEYLRVGEYDRTEALIERVARIVGENDDTLQARGNVAWLRGDVADGAKYFARAYAENPNSTINKIWYGWALLSIADYETVLEIGMPEHRMQALAALGETDEARKVLASLELENPFRARVLTEVGDLMTGLHAYAEYIDLMRDHFGSLDDLAQFYEADQGWGTDYLGTLAFAYLQVGDDASFRQLLAEMKRILDRYASGNSDNYFYYFDRLQYEVLGGRFDAALATLSTAIDRGFVYRGRLELPLFDDLRADPRFAALDARLTARVDEERAKLGLPPYRPPIPASEERPTFVN